MRNRIMKNARAGFTLVEVLVTLVLIALLVGVIVPAVMGQLDRGDHTRIMSDAEGVRSGVKMFRVDVKRYPATIEQLTEAPGSSGADWTRVTDFNGATIPDGLLDRWGGPYVEGSSVADESTTLSTAAGGEIEPVFVDSLNLAGTQYLSIEFSGLTRATITTINEEVDGTGTLNHPDVDGRIRADSVGSDLRMYYLAVPIN